MVGCVLLVKLLYALFRWWRLASARIDRIDEMSGLEFEQYLEQLFRRLGYQVERTRYSGDFGADLVLMRKDESCVVQAKRKSGRVGVSAIQQAVAARAMYECDAAMVVTNSHFTLQAEELAAANDVELWDRERLVAEVLRVAPIRTQVLAEEPDEEEPKELPSEPPCREDREGWDEAVTSSSPALCRTCGREVTNAVRTYCQSNATRFGGAIYCQTHLRRATASRSRAHPATSRRRPRE